MFPAMALPQRTRGAGHLSVHNDPTTTGVTPPADLKRRTSTTQHRRRRSHELGNDYPPRETHRPRGVSIEEHGDDELLDPTDDSSRATEATTRPSSRARTLLLPSLSSTSLLRFFLSSSSARCALIHLRAHPSAIWDRHKLDLQAYTIVFDIIDERSECATSLPCQERCVC